MCLSCGLVVAGLDSSASMSVSAAGAVTAARATVTREGERIVWRNLELRRTRIPLHWIVGFGCVFVAAWTAAFPSHFTHGDGWSRCLSYQFHPLGIPIPFEYSLQILHHSRQ